MSGKATGANRVPPELLGQRPPAIGYLRVSSAGQVDGDGLARQRDAIGRFAAAVGFEIVEWFEDAGVSGATDLDDRPGLMDALARIAGGGAQAVIVEAEHRLARRLEVQEAIIRQFREAGATILTADGHDLTNDADDMRVLMRQIIGAIAEFEKRSLVRRMRAARDRRRGERGFCEGRPPYGHDEAERRLVDRMRSLRRRGRSYRAVADALNADGVRTRPTKAHPQGRAWASRDVFNVLRRWRTMEKFLAAD